MQQDSSAIPSGSNRKQRFPATSTNRSLTDVDAVVKRAISACNEIAEMTGDKQRAYHAARPRRVKTTDARSDPDAGVVDKKEDGSAVSDRHAAAQSSTAEGPLSHQGKSGENFLKGLSGYKLGPELLEYVRLAGMVRAKRVISGFLRQEAEISGRIGELESLAARSEEEEGQLEVWRGMLSQTVGMKDMMIETWTVEDA